MSSNTTGVSVSFTLLQKFHNKVLWPPVELVYDVFHLYFTLDY